jgi:hypothetical protein
MAILNNQMVLHKNGVVWSLWMDPTTVEKSLSHRFSLRHCVWPSETTVSTDLGKNQPNVCIYAYLYKYVYIYTYILSICIYLSMCIVGSTHLKISKLWVKWSSSYHVESVAPASTASTNGVPFPFIIGLHIPWISQWGYISTIVRPNIYWIYTYIYIYTNGSWPWAVKTFPAANLFLRQPCVNQVAIWGLTHCCVNPTRLHLHGWHSWFSTYQKKSRCMCIAGLYDMKNSACVWYVHPF